MHVKFAVGVSGLAKGLHLIDGVTLDMNERSWRSEEQMRDNSSIGQTDSDADKAKPESKLEKINVIIRSDQVSVCLERRRQNKMKES